VRWGRYQHRLASGHASVGNPDDAVRHAQRATLHLQNGGASSRELAAAFDTVAACHHQRGDLDAAARARCQAVTTLEQDAASSTDCVLALTRLADLRRLQGLYADAENLLTRTLAKVPDGDRGEQMTSRALVLNALGIVYKDTGRYIAANHAYNTALGLIIAAHGPDDPATAALWHNLAGLAQARGHPHQAIPLATRAVELRERQLGPHHYLVAEDLAVLGAALLDADRVDDAEPLFHRALAIFRARHPAHRYDVAVNLANLAACRYARGDARAAAELIREGLAIRKLILGADHPEIARQLENHAVVAADNTERRCHR
jgi:tetratricopeptide (TPR) repeat protein